MGVAKRFAIYCFYDLKGVVGEYVYYYLEALKKVTDYIYVVSNCKIRENDLLRLEQIVDRVDFRTNYGYDAYAYKYALDRCQNELASYDELILSNNSFYGPVYSLDAVFTKMSPHSSESEVITDNLLCSNKDSKYDFWGITIHPRIEAKINEKQHYSYVNEHVQSYFIVFQKNVFSSELFLGFFKNLPKIESFLDAVVLFELELTRVLSENGSFKYGAYVDYTLFPKCNYVIPYAYELYKNEKSPFVKRKVFYEEYHEFIAIGRGNQGCRLLDDLTRNQIYPVDYIWADMLRTQPMSVLRQNMHLNLILSENESSASVKQTGMTKVALIVYIYYKDLVATCLSYAKNLANIADIYVVCSSDETMDDVRKQCSGSIFRSINFIKKVNKGRDVSSYLIDARFVFDKYEYVCYFHDKKSPQLSNKYIVDDFFYHCIDSILPSEIFAVNVIQQFEENPRLGMLVPPPLNWGPFYCSEYNLNHDNKRLMLELIQTLNLNVPFDEFPVAPYGDFFWVRSKAIKPLFNKNWVYEDLPDEPLPVDGTILHAIERILPFCAQSAGYYVSWLNSHKTEIIYENNCYYYVRMFNESMFKIFPMCDLVVMRKILNSMVNNSSKSKKEDNLNNVLLNHADIVHKYKILRNKLFKYTLINRLTLNLIPKFYRRENEIRKEISKFVI